MKKFIIFILSLTLGIIITVLTINIIITKIIESPVQPIAKITYPEQLPNFDFNSTNPNSEYNNLRKKIADEAYINLKSYAEENHVPLNTFIKNINNQISGIPDFGHAGYSEFTDENPNAKILTQIKNSNVIPLQLVINITNTNRPITAPLNIYFEFNGKIMNPKIPTSN